MNAKKKTEKQLSIEMEELHKQLAVLEDELKRTKGALQGKENLYLLITNNTYDMISRHLPDSTYLYVSPACRTLFGYEPEELLGTKAFDQMHPEDVKRIIAITQEAVNKGGYHIGQYRHHKKDGQYIWVETVGKVIKNKETGVIEDIVCVVRDITERKRAEKTLKESEDRYHSFVRNFQGIAFHGRMDFTPIFFNGSVEQITGYKEDDFLAGKPRWNEVIYPDDLSSIFTEDEKKLHSIPNFSFDREYRIVRKDGQIRWVHEVILNICDEAGNPTTLQGCIYDISERKHAEDEVLKIKQEWENIFQAIGHSTIILDAEHNILSANKATLKAAGAASEGELIGRKCYEIFHHASKPPTGCPLVKMLDSGKLEESEMEVEALGGTFLVSCTPVLDKRGNIQKIIHIATDITERKIVQEALGESEERYRSLVENETELVARFKPDGTFIFVNDAYCYFFGKAKDELIGKTWSPLPIDEDIPHIQEKLLTLSAANPIVTIENRVVSSKGDIRWMQFVNRGFFNSHGELLEIQSVGRDITELKKTQGKLEAEKTWSEAIVSSAPNIIVGLGENSEILLFNKFAEKLTGYTAAEVMGKRWIEIFIPAEMRPRLYGVWDEIINNKLIEHHHENSIIMKNGQQRQISWSNTILNENGRFKMILSVGEDITERKQAEDALRESEVALHDYYFAEATLNMILKESLTDISLEEILQKALNMVLSVPWLALEPMGFIYLIEDEPDALVMKVKNSLSTLQKPPCTRVPFGQCLCGKAAQNQKILFASQTDKQHSICCEGIQPHSHYIIPILYGGKTLGVINVYLKEDYREKPRDREFLLAVADTLAVIIMRKKTEEEKDKIQAQLLQAQKMEVVGQLAGGIAHDFNNILTALIGYGHMLKMKMDPNDPLRSYTDHILILSDRAANLTQSLLAFSRKQVMNARPVDLNDIIKKVEHLLSRVIGEDIHLETMRSKEDLIVMADPGHIEQMLMNLATNARDAMPEGGTLTIHTETHHIDNEFIKEHGFGKEGSYALITCTDTGVGMDRDTKVKIFDPFFTTKEVGKGTGLGLAMVYGIVKQHNGYINVYSEPGQGTTFRIYLPLIEEHITEKQDETIQTIERGTETILLAEDEAEVREFTKNLLKEYGYTVITAVDGHDAIEEFTVHKNKIQLVLLDVIMPKKNGREAFTTIRQIKPDVKALFISGYPADIIHRQGLLEAGFAYIEKPLSPVKLLRKIREVLKK